MQIGVISEGHSDRAVITNILIGLTNIDISDIRAIMPIYKLDATDMALKDAREFSNWSLVKKECEERELIEPFLSLEGHDFIVIHIDAAECELYAVHRPHRKDKNYCVDLRQSVVVEIKKWLEGNFLDQVLYAIAIEETEAWILAIYSDEKNTTRHNNPKKHLQKVLSKKDLDSTVSFENYFELTRNLSKKKKLSEHINSNCSLQLFCEEVNQKIGSLDKN